MAVEGKLIEEYFQKLEWPFEKVDDHNWQSGYKGETFTFNFFVRTDENWLYVYAPFPVKIKADARANMYEHLMRLNYRINMAKFMLDNDGDVGLTAEVPNEGLSDGTSPFGFRRSTLPSELAAFCTPFGCSLPSLLSTPRSPAAMNIVPSDPKAMRAP